MIDIHSLIFWNGRAIMKRKEAQICGLLRSRKSANKRAIGVAQGLCYRYFPSKEVLFDSAIDQYADILVAQFADLAENSNIPLKEFIEKMPTTVEDKNTKYYAVFHGPQNKKFHNQLSLKTCEKLVPIVEKLLLKAKQKGEIQFCVYGQLGILLEDGMDQKEKANRIRAFLIYALHL